jgi:hypothetical protein
MTIPFERTRALLQTRELLRQLKSPSETRRIPRWLREQAKALATHFPTYADVEQAHQALPELYGPVPPFSRLSGTGDVCSVIEATKNTP